MAKYEVTRSFPTYRRGQVIEVGDWKNLEKLVRTGYLRRIEEVKGKEAVKVEESPSLPASKQKPGKSGKGK